MTNKQSMLPVRYISCVLPNFAPSAHFILSDGTPPEYSGSFCCLFGWPRRYVCSGSKPRHSKNVKASNTSPRIKCRLPSLQNRKHLQLHRIVSTIFAGIIRGQRRVCQCRPRWNKLNPRLPVSLAHLTGR